MKRGFFSTVALLLGILSFAQAPQKFSYQAVAVDQNGLELRNTAICIRSSILKSSFNGQAEWIEAFPSISTDDFGLFTIEIGNGVATGGSQAAFSEIKWGADKYYLKVEMSLDGGCSNYQLVGTNQLLSVPYALHAETSSTAITATSAVFADTALYASATNDLDPNPTNELQNLSLNGSTLTLSGSTGPAIDLNVSDPDHDPTNELQDLSLSGSSLTLSGSSAPPIDLNTSDPDHDPTNELQDLTLNGSSLTLSGSAGPAIDLNASDPDHDPTNELQVLTLSGNTLTLSGSNSSVNLTPVIPDTDPNNELQNLTANGSILTLSNSSAPPIDMNASDPDHDPENELQDLTANGSVLTLSGSSTPPIDMNASDPDHDPTNEFQELTYNQSGNMLGLTNSNVTISLSNLPGFNASGSDLDFPQGVSGAKYVFIPDQVSVPADSVFYIIACEDAIILPGIGNSFGIHNTSPNLPILKSGTQVDNCRCIGFFKPVDPTITAVTAVLNPNQNNFYQVPFGKNFVLKSGLDIASPITLNGFTISPVATTFKAFVIPSGIQIRNLGNDEMIITGYLITQ